MGRKIDPNSIRPVVGTLCPTPFDLPCRAREREKLGDAARGAVTLVTDDEPEILGPGDERYYDMPTTHGAGRRQQQALLNLDSSKNLLVRPRFS